MTDKEIKLQLAIAGKIIKPRPEWKERSKEILMSQVGATSRATKLGGFELFVSALTYGFRNLATQPTSLVFAIIGVVVAGSLLMNSYARNTQPGDSLYIAKKIGERTELALTFTEKEKTRVNLEIAGSRAKELTAVLSQDENAPERGEAVAALAQDLKKEIATARTRLGKMAPVVKAPAEETGAGTQTQAATGTAEAPSQVFSADIGKEENGVQISNTSASAIAGEATVEASGTALKTEVRPVIGEGGLDPAKALEEAAKLFNQEDYAGALDKLDEASAIVEMVDPGEVKGESETAVPESSTTPMVLIDDEKATGTK